MSLIYLAKSKSYVFDYTIDSDFIGITVAPFQNDEYIFISLSTPMDKIHKKIVELSEKYSIVKIHPLMFMNGNIPVKPVSMYKWPNGETCRKLVKKVLEKNSKKFYLVSQDDGTRSTLPPMYYGLKASNLLHTFRPFQSIVYAKNYMSCSSSDFSRAKLHINILNVRYPDVDYILSPGFLDEQKTFQLYQWCRETAREGAIIFTKINSNLPLPTHLYHLKRDMYFYHYNFRTETKSIGEINLSKPSNKELLPFLRGQRG